MKAQETEPAHVLTVHNGYSLSLELLHDVEGVHLRIRSDDGSLDDDPPGIFLPHAGANELARALLAIQAVRKAVRSAVDDVRQARVRE